MWLRAKEKHFTHINKNIPAYKNNGPNKSNLANNYLEIRYFFSI